MVKLERLNMAWVVNSDVGHFGHIVFETDESLEAMKTFFKSVSLAPEWFPRIGVELNRGVRVSPDVIPKHFEYRRTNQVKELHEFVNLGGYFLGVSERFRMCVEAIEPDVHQFIPVELKMADASFYPEQYYILNVLNLIDTLDAEVSTVESNFQGIIPGWGYTLAGPAPLQKLVVRKSAIQGRAMWAELRFHGYGPFCSDALMERLEQAGRSSGIEKRYRAIEA
jgi:Protein of unknown function (DUF1629)